MRERCVPVRGACLPQFLSQEKWGAKSSSSMPETAWNLTPRASLGPHSIALQAGTVLSHALRPTEIGGSAHSHTTGKRESQERTSGVAMVAQQCVSKKLARLGLPRSTDLTQPRTLPPAFTTQAPASETAAWGQRSHAAGCRAMFLPRS